MKIRRENAVSIILVLCAGLSAATGQNEESLSLLNDGIQALSDDSRIIFEDSDHDGGLAKEMEELMKEERAFKEEERAYKRDLAEFLKNKSRHEGEMVDFVEEKAKLEKKLKEYKEPEKEDDERSRVKSEELDGLLLQLELHEIALPKQQQDVEQEEEELATLEGKEMVSQKELSDITEKLTKREKDLSKLLEELETRRQILVKDAEEEEKRLQAIHGACIDIPKGFVEYVKNYEEGKSKLCYTLYEEDDDELFDHDIDIRMN